MSFLNSFFLWGLAAASLPVIIHLIKRNKAVRLPFAAIRFLRVEPAERYRSQRLKQIILLALRMLAIALLVLAFARPYLADKQTAAFWGDQPEAAVILLDNSFSMAADDRFQAAVARTKELLRSFRPQDEVTVMQFSESTTMVGQSDGNPAALASQFDSRLSRSTRSTNYMQALQAGESILLEAPHNVKKIYVISDFQKTGWDALNPHWKILEGIGVEFIQIGKEPAANVAVRDLYISRDQDTGKRAEVLARVKNFSNEKNSVNTVLRLGDRKVSQRTLTFKPGEEKTVRFRRVSLSGRFVTGAIEIDVENDAIELDNQYHFVLKNESEAQILAINGEPKRDPAQDELFFLERAINLDGLAKYSLVRTNANTIDNHDFKDYRTIILANVRNLSRSAVERLTYYVRGGGGLIITLGDRVSPNLYNQMLAELSPANITNRAFQAIDRHAGVILAEVDYQHPVFRLFADPGQSDPSMAEFYQYFYAEAFDENAVLARFDDGSPAILERGVGAGKVILFTSSIDTEWNNLPIKALYLPLLYQTLDYVVAEPKGQESLLVGNPVPLRGFGINMAAGQKAEIRTPEGAEIEVENDIFERTEHPGIYEVRKAGAGKTSGFFAVNVDIRESDLAQVSEAELQAKVASVSSEVETASLGGAQITSQVEENQKLWRFGILLVVLILIAETWLGNRTYR